MTNVLSGMSIEELKEEWKNIELNLDIDVRDNLEEEIQNILADKSEETLRERKAVVQSVINGYNKNYGSVAELDKKIFDENRELDEILSVLQSLSDDVLDQEKFEEETKKITEILNGVDGTIGLKDEIEELFRNQGRNAEKAEGIDLYMLEQETKELQEIFEQKKRLYGQYRKIKEDFEFLKNQQGDKFAVFYELFNRYLSIITDEQVQMDDGKLKSNSNILSNKEILSRGTKQTILLAFRLALLKYYYQDEGGILVLDDILLDMDPERRQHSVNLLQEFAKENQIIFTTCDPLIAEMLGGNRINIS